MGLRGAGFTVWGGLGDLDLVLCVWGGGGGLKVWGFRVYGVLLGP